MYETVSMAETARRVNEYVTGFKRSMVECVAQGKSHSQMLHEINNYPEFNNKKKRAKSTAMDGSRCIGKQQFGKQCTRTQKEGSEFCGTHIKSTPFGVVDTGNPSKDQVNLTVVAITSNGIAYLVDNNYNVYDTEDVQGKKINPNIIGTWKSDTAGNYIISLHKNPQT